MLGGRTLLSPDSSSRGLPWTIASSMRLASTLSRFCSREVILPVMPARAVLQKHVESDVWCNSIQVSRHDRLIGQENTPACPVNVVDWIHRKIKIDDVIHSARHVQAPATGMCQICGNSKITFVTTFKRCLARKKQTVQPGLCRRAQADPDSPAGR